LGCNTFKKRKHFVLRVDAIRLFGVQSATARSAKRVAGISVIAKGLAAPRSQTSAPAILESVTTAASKNRVSLRSGRSLHPHLGPTAISRCETADETGGARTMAGKATMSARLATEIAALRGSGKGAS